MRAIPEELDLAVGYERMTSVTMKWRWTFIGESLLEIAPAVIRLCVICKMSRRGENRRRERWLSSIAIE
jgi:hypothetical protein